MIVRDASAIASVFLSCVAVACGGADTESHYVSVDTLSGTIVRTISHHPSELGRWSLQPLFDLAPPPGDSTELLDPGDLALAGDGSLAVAEHRPAHVKIFSPNGTYLRSVGRPGEGPGEFRSPFVAFAGDTLVVQDPMAARASTFNWNTGEFLGVRVTACCYWAPVSVDGSGRVVVRSIAPSPDSTAANVQAYVRFKPGALSVDTIFAAEGSRREAEKTWQVREGGRLRMIVSPPLQHAAVYAVDPQGGFIIGWSGEYLLRESRDGRDTVALFGRELSPASVSATEKAAMVEQRITSIREDNDWANEADLRKSFDPSAIPDTRPAFEDFWVDGSGRRWVWLSQPDTNVVMLDLFDPAGRWLDVLRVPARDWQASGGSPRAVGRDRIAVRLEGADGRPFVRVYAIIRKD